ncbi:MAG: NAD(P)H-binding protein [Candidatus Kapaibacterium sp.]
MRTLIIGATGLVGSELVRLLANDSRFTSVTVLSRRPIAGFDGHPTIRNVVKDFDALTGDEGIYDVDVVFCAMGTTIKTAGSKEVYRRIDHTYPMKVATFARAKGARHWVIVSSGGISENSRFFYIQVKADLERDLRALNFPQLTILRPSLILGDRREFRLGERIGMVLMTRLNFAIPKAYKAVEARAIASTMIRVATDGSTEPYRSIENEVITL